MIEWRWWHIPARQFPADFVVQNLIHRQPRGATYRHQLQN